MTWRERLSSIRDTRLAQASMFVLGVLLIIAAPIASPLPGPGGILLFAGGLTLILRTSLWAKKRYVAFKRWQPRAGGWADWGLRRGSARRRVALAKERDRAEAQPPECIPRTDDPLPHAGFEIAPIDPTPAELRPSADPVRH